MGDEEALRWRVTKAVRASSLPAPARLIMLVLADVADVATGEVPERFTPSLGELARETGLGRSTVAAHLQALERDGWVLRARPSTGDALARGERTRYALLVPAGSGTSADAELVPELDGPEEGLSSPAPVQASPRARRSSPRAGHRNRSSDQGQIGSDPSLPHDSAAKTKPRQKGSRIPDDFHVTAEMRTWAMTNVPSLAGSRETEKFINYWQAKAGRDACKLNWVATWKNWMLTAAERQGKKPPQSVLDDPAVRAASRELFPDRQEGAA